MSYDIKKAKTEHDSAFVTYFEGVYRDQVEKMERMRGHMEKMKQDLRMLTALVEDSINMSQSMVRSNESSFFSTHQRGGSEISEHTLIRIFTNILKLMKLISQTLINDKQWRKKVSPSKNTNKVIY